MDRWWADEQRCELLDALATRIGPVTAPVERLAGPATWIGPAADDALAALGLVARLAGDAAVSLRQAAAEARARIAAEREAAARLAREAERAARDRPVHCGAGLIPPCRP